MDEGRWLAAGELRKRAAKYLFSFPGVHAVGARHKEIDGVRQGRPAISVYVTRKRDPRDLGPGATIPKEIWGCPTDVHVMPVARASAGQFTDLDTKFPELQGGIAIQSSDGPGAATLGCLAEVTPASGPKFPVALTCQHVLAAKLRTGVDTDAVVGQPSLSSWCASFWSKSNIIGTCLWGANTGELTMAGKPGVDAGAVKLKAGQKYRRTIFDALATGTTTRGTRDLTTADVGGGQNALHMIGKSSYGVKGRSNGALADICSTIELGLDGKPYFYEDCLLILNPDKTSFSIDADSGAIVYDNQRRVVGILIAGSPSETMTLRAHDLSTSSAFNSGCVNANKEVTHLFEQPGSWACQIKNVISQFQADTNMTLSIPDTQDDSVQTAEGDPTTVGGRMALTAEQEAALDLANQRFRETEVGRETYRLIYAHQTEMRHLIHTNRKVATAWHRIGGPSVAFMLLDAVQKPSRPFPADFGGYALKQGIRTLGDRLSRFGSPELRRDLDSIVPVLEAVPGASLDDLFAKFHEVSSAASTGIGPR